MLLFLLLKKGDDNMKYTLEFKEFVMYRKFRTIEEVMNYVRRNNIEDYRITNEYTGEVFNINKDILFLGGIVC